MIDLGTRVKVRHKLRAADYRNAHLGWSPYMRRCEGAVGKVTVVKDYGDYVAYEVRVEDYGYSFWFMERDLKTVTSLDRFFSL